MNNIEDIFNLIKETFKGERVENFPGIIYVGYLTSNIILIIDSKNIYVQSKDYLEKAEALKANLKEKSLGEWNIKKEFTPQ